MHTVKKVKVVILEPYKELLLWLCIADKSIRPQEFGNVILEFCTRVNKAVVEPMTAPRPTEPISTEKNRMAVINSTWGSTLSPLDKESLE